MYSATFCKCPRRNAAGYCHSYTINCLEAIKKKYFLGLMFGLHRDTFVEVFLVALPRVQKVFYIDWTISKRFERFQRILSLVFTIGHI